MVVPELSDVLVRPVYLESVPEFVLVLPVFTAVELVLPEFLD